jgi:serine/threonine protein kinase
MLSGDAPFCSDNRISILLAHLYKPPKPITFWQSEGKTQAEELMEVVHTCLNKNPEDRFESIYELRKALTEKPTGSARLPENLVGDRRLRYKQYYHGPVDAAVYDNRTSAINPVLSSRLLVIESNDIPIESSITPLLRITNHEVDSPFSLTAVDLDKTKLPDAVILNKSKEENLNIIRDMKAQRKWNDIPVLICGPEHDLDYISQAIDAGAGDYFSYPFDPKEIIKKIERLYKKYDLIS